MQFGRIHGIALIVLGAVLLAIQMMISLPGPKPEPQRPQVGVAREHQASRLPAIFGTVLLVGGLVVLSTAARRDEPSRDHAVK
jgi:hypothetical protein